MEFRANQIYLERKSVANEYPIIFKTGKNDIHIRIMDIWRKLFEYANIMEYWSHIGLSQDPA